MTLKKSFLYSQTSAKLVVEGLPDLSLDQIENNIGIVLSWKMSLVGSSQLEGKLEHLKSLMIVVLPYARYCISNVKKDIGESTSSVSIGPLLDKHRILLRSSQPDISPLEILLDDAELSDLVRCLDSLRNDPRVLLDWDIPPYIPLDKHEKKERKSIIAAIAIPVVGVCLTISSGLMYLMIPNFNQPSLTNEVIEFNDRSN